MHKDWKQKIGQFCKPPPTTIHDSKIIPLLIEPSRN